MAMKKLAQNQRRSGRPHAAYPKEIEKLLNKEKTVFTVILIRAKCNSDLLCMMIRHVKNADWKKAGRMTCLSNGRVTCGGLLGLLSHFLPNAQHVIRGKLSDVRSLRVVESTTRGGKMAMKKLVRNRRRSGKPHAAYPEEIEEQLNKEKIGFAAVRFYLLTWQYEIGEELMEAVMWQIRIGEKCNYDVLYIMIRQVKNAD
ncbi:hypothetical protein Scep_007430 [Stephania cephalantha]|uniref:Uncharacterized protein n=1 Tax=Stephania cephalantha TaxID=152367 RepID=A0AAP0PL35_9MAGN